MHQIPYIQFFSRISIFSLFGITFTSEIIFYKKKNFLTRKTDTIKSVTYFANIMTHENIWIYGICLLLNIKKLFIQH